MSVKPATSSNMHPRAVRCISVSVPVNVNATFFLQEQLNTRGGYIKEISYNIRREDQLFKHCLPGKTVVPIPARTMTGNGGDDNWRIVETVDYEKDNDVKTVDGMSVRPRDADHSMGRRYRHHVPLHIGGVVENPSPWFSIPGISLEFRQ